MEKGVTVLICSFNSATRITETIEHLAAQQFTNPLNWEIIFIDNASTDNCGMIARQAWEKYQVRSFGISSYSGEQTGKNICPAPWYFHGTVWILCDL